MYPALEMPQETYFLYADNVLRTSHNVEPRIEIELGVVKILLGKKIKVHVKELKIQGNREGILYFVHLIVLENDAACGHISL